MCVEFDARPPLAPIAGAAISHARLVLEAADGNRLAAFAARPDQPTDAVGVVILPDVRGLFGFYEELALRLAETGHPAVAFDYFGRTAGAEPRGADFPYGEHVPLTTPGGVQTDVAAAVAYLRSPEGGGCAKVATVGFCFGGRHSWLAAGAGHGLVAAVGFYGNPAERNGQPGPTQLASTFAAPILALMAGADPHITADLVAEFDAALAAAGVEHEVVSYPDAPHSFFDRTQDAHAEASADAWRRTLAFVDR